jgi:hypothetical protein
MDALFTAVDITGVSTSVSTLMVGFIGISLIFFGYNVVRKVLNRGV